MKKAMIALTIVNAISIITLIVAFFLIIKFLT